MEPPPPIEFIRDQVAKMAWTERDNVRPDARFIDFGLDSVRAMDLVIELEETYGVEVPDKDLADLNTLQDVADYVEKKRGA